MTSKILFSNNFDDNKVKTHVLDEDFYSSIRKEVTRNRLTYLSEESKNLVLPKIFGQFSSEEHYLKTVDLFIRATEETRNRGVFFLRNVLPHIQNYHAFLDVGPGNGNLTRWVGRKFKEITLIDPVPQVLDNIVPRSFPKGTVLKKICQPFLQAILTHSYFDLIVLSHVMYHFPQTKWISVVEKALHALKPHGMIAIVINSGLDRERLGNAFNGTTYPINHFVQQITQLGKKVEFISSKESFYAEDLTTMLHICGLHLHDTGGYTNQSDLEEQINSNYLLTNNTYKMDVYQHFIMIKNENSEGN
jgi:2-polyprenyl-3-methyl-5-hydroxy-6-metoxy-1,4-benzoquinol methylase